MMFVADVIARFMDHTLTLIAVTAIGRQCLIEYPCHQMDYALFVSTGLDEQALELIYSWLEERLNLYVL